MDYRVVERPAGAFQRPVTELELRAVIGRAFGAGTWIDSVVELGDGMYNTTYRVDLRGVGPVVLRVSPEPGRQYRSEPELMRNEFASIPYLAPIAALMPDVLAIDFTHDILGRDYMFQSWLAGVPAPAGLQRYDRAQFAGFYRQIGTLARAVHGVSGPGFGRVAGPWHPSWSGALLDWFDCAIADLTDAGLDSTDARQLLSLVARNRAVLDEVRIPRLLHGDLWIVNLILAEANPLPIITGVVDSDRTWWGDPESDWPIFMTLRKPGTERDAFWESYGPLDSSPAGTWRRLIYLARHTLALRLEGARLGREPDHIAAGYRDVEDLLTRLQSIPV